MNFNEFSRDEGPIKTIQNINRERARERESERAGASHEQNQRSGIAYIANTVNPIKGRLLASQLQ